MSCPPDGVSTVFIRVLMVLPLAAGKIRSCREDPER
jgi:hypothetical protein